MSVVSSVLSSRSSAWRINVRFASLMDSIFAIGFGLGLRYVVDFVSRHDFKLTGTLVGLWEGVILLHFLKKMPKSSDPYIAYGVRLFIDFLFTESIARLVLVLIWTGLGMVLADITPAIWDDVGLNRTWRHFRRDLYTISRMIPTVAFFPPTRTVRFSPSREPSIIIPEATSVISPPSVITTEQTPVTIDPPQTTIAREPVRRRVPGYFPVEFSDTETELGSVRGTPGRTSRRLSVYPQRRDSNDTVSERSSSLSQNDDLDEANLSSTSSDATEKAEPSSIPEDITQIPEMYTEEDILVDVAPAPTKPEEGELTPKQRQPIYMPPTPSDSAARWPLNREVDEPLPVRPLSESLPQIPDFLEEPGSEDWENIRREDYADEKPPTPPAKDGPSAFKVPIVSAPVPPPAKTTKTPPSDDNMEGWDTLDSQFISRPDDADAAATDDTRRQSQPPPYETNYDDIYDDPPKEEYDPASHETNHLNTDANLIDTDTGVPPATIPSTSTGNVSSAFPPISGQFNFSASNPWAPKPSDAEALEAKKRKDAEEEAARLAEEDKRKEDDEKQRQTAAEREAEEERKKEEEEAKRKEEEEKERLKQESEKKKKEKEERWLKERADDAARKKKRVEEEAAEAKRLQEEVEKKADEEAAQRKKDAEEAKARKFEERKEKKAKEAAEEAKRLKEEAEKKELEEAAAKKKREEEEAAEKQRKEEAEAKRQKEEAEEKKKQEEVAQRKRDAEEARARREEAERKKQEEQTRQEEEAKKNEEAQKVEEERLRDEEKKKEEEQKQKEEERTQREAADAEQRQQEEEKQEEEESKKRQEEEDANVLEVPPAPAPTSQEVVEDSPLEKPLPNTPPVAQPTDDAGQGLVSDAVEEESVVSEASEMPEKVRDRLEILLTLKAQMAETEKCIDSLKTRLGKSTVEDKIALEQELKAAEKSLRKMQRKEQRRWEEVPEPWFLNKSRFDTPELISVDSISPRDTETKIEEKLEKLLTPGTRSFTFQVKAPTGNPGKKVMPNVTKTLERYKLYGYTTSDKSNTRHMTIKIAETQYVNWLVAYRTAATQEDEDSSGYDYP